MGFLTAIEKAVEFKDKGELKAKGESNPAIKHEYWFLIFYLKNDKTQNL